MVVSFQERAPCEDQIVPDIDSQTQPAHKKIKINPVIIKQETSSTKTYSDIERFLLNIDKEEHVSGGRSETSLVPTIKYNPAATSLKRKGPPVRRLSEDARPLTRVELDMHKDLIASHSPTIVTTVSMLPDSNQLLTTGGSTAGGSIQPVAAPRVHTERHLPASVIRAIQARQRMRQQRPPYTQSLSYTDVMHGRIPMTPLTPAIAVTAVSFPAARLTPASTVVASTPTNHELPPGPVLQALYDMPNIRHSLTRSNSQPAAGIIRAHSIFRATTSNPIQLSQHQSEQILQTLLHSNSRTTPNERNASQSSQTQSQHSSSEDTL